MGTPSEFRQNISCGQSRIVGVVEGEKSGGYEGLRDSLFDMSVTVTSCEQGRSQDFHSGRIALPLPVPSTPLPSLPPLPSPSFPFPSPSRGALPHY